MTALTLESEDLSPALNPIDLVEEMVAAKEWAFSRCDADELLVEMKGRWCTYQLHFFWRENLNALYFSCAIENKVPDNRKQDMYELLATVNERLWLGHFEIVSEEAIPIFRHTSLLGGQYHAAAEQVEDLIDIATTECDRFYPAFQMVCGGGRAASEAVALSLVDVAGEA